ncbi:YHS domain-containing (seleno)protein [Thalassospiraceae bacterium LMO-JJ14]|nr:YHS domain-containing (seleno)protein [Thalassospiraceae bacterium LMO-JJ14]
MDIKSYFVVAVMMALSVFFTTVAFADDEYNVAKGLTLTGNPLGMHGVDPISLFESDEPKIGNAEFTSEHEGVDYYFASAEAKKRFEANPELYVPQFGGFCAFGVNVGKKLDGDARYADILDGKLYLFVNDIILQKYLKNREQIIAGAYDKWPGIRSTPVENL